MRKAELETLIKELYEVEPKVFFKLNEIQRKIFIRFLNEMLDQDNRNDLFVIIDEVMKLNTDERSRLVALLEVTQLSHIIETVELIKNRSIILDKLKQLVFDEELKANEVNHLQRFIEKNFWVFGEEYRLVAAAENKFDTALRNFREETGQKYDNREKIKHGSRLREMDIFLVRQNKTNDTIDNLVVELKHPQKKVGQKELDQIKDYMSVIASDPRFNANSYTWKFILVGKSYSDYIENEIANAKGHGEDDLVFYNAKNGYKIYVQKWSDIMNEVDLRHEFLQERLKIQRDKIYEEHPNVESLLSTGAVHSPSTTTKIK